MIPPATTVSEFVLPSRSALDAVLLEGIRLAFHDPRDALAPMAAAQAVDDLIELDPERPRSWFLRGFGTHPRDPEPRVAPGEAVEPYYVSGLIAGAADRGDGQWLVRVIETHGEMVRRVMAEPVEPAIVAPVLVALVVAHPGHALSLAAIAATDVPYVGEVVDAFEARAAAAERNSPSKRDRAAALREAAARMRG